MLPRHLLTSLRFLVRIADAARAALRDRESPHCRRTRRGSGNGRGRSMTCRPLAAAFSTVAIGAALLASSAHAATFSQNEFFAYNQTAWGLPSTAAPASLLRADPAAELQFYSIFPTGLMIGTLATHYALFDTGQDVLNYLPDTSAPGVLTTNESNPQSTSSGVFGAEVLTLNLNVAYNDVGPIADTFGNVAFTHPDGVTWGDLILKGFVGSESGLNGLAIRQLLPLSENLVGGGVAPFSVMDISSLLISINATFEDGYVSDFAEAHLALPAAVTAPVPESSNLEMLLGGFALMGVVSRTRKSRRRARCASGRLVPSRSLAPKMSATS